MGKIVIDAGHGGRDVGAVGRNSTEASNVLKVALELSKILKRFGHTVVLTRSNNTFISLRQRSVISNMHKPDIFVSLHNNSATNNSATGFETFILHNGVSTNTKRLQNAIHKHIINGIPLRDRGKKTKNLSVLRETVAPAVLIEYGFINNVSDEKYLINNHVRLAQLTADGINEYFGIKSKLGQSVTNKPSPKPQPKPQSKPQVTNQEEKAMQQQLKLLEEKVLKLENAKLHDTQKRDMAKLLKSAFNEGVFHVDHSKKVENMTKDEAFDLMLSFLARKMS